MHRRRRAIRGSGGSGRDSCLPRRRRRRHRGAGVNKFLELFVSGVSLGAIYALIALGFVIIFKATEVVNFAGGALLVVGTYFTARFHNDNHLNFWLAALCGLLVAVAVAVFVERVLVRP